MGADGTDPADAAFTPALATELRRILLDRLTTYQSLVQDILEGLDESRAGLKAALQLVAQYPDAVRAAFEHEWSDNPDYRRQTAENHLKLLHETIEEVDDFLLRAVEADIPPVLSMAVERRCRSLLAEPRVAVVTLGPPENYTTLVGDLEAWLLENLELPEGYEPPSARPRRFALLQVPRLEGTASLWRPIILGHEVAHLAVAEQQALDRFDWEEALPEEVAARVDPPPEIEDALKVDTFREWAQNWCEELLCDAFAAALFGPAAVAALGSFFHSADAHGYGPTHPPGWLRLELIVRWVEESDPGPCETILQPWREAAKPPSPPLPEWVHLLAGVMRNLGDAIITAVEPWSGGRFDARSHEREIEHVARQLSLGLPAIEHPDHSTGRTLDDAHILNGAWLAARSETAYPCERLADYSLESLEFVRQWFEAGGEAFGDRVPELHVETANPEGPGLLSENAIRSRLRSDGADRLVITPLFDQAIGGGTVDLRLGNKFVLFRSSRIEAFNPLNRGTDARAMQTYVEKAWGQPFVLHPHELVLAGVLEYVSLPADLMGVVATRSSYGRLGLVTATATLVHPHYKGCLTLELVNLSEVPLSLTPGQRVAQLVLHTVVPPAPPRGDNEKYRCPIRPEFSKVQLDRDQRILEKMRSNRSTRA